MFISSGAAAPHITATDTEQAKEVSVCDVAIAALHSAFVDPKHDWNDFKKKTIDVVVAYHKNNISQDQCIATIKKIITIILEEDKHGIDADEQTVYMVNVFNEHVVKNTTDTLSSYHLELLRHRGTIITKKECSDIYKIAVAALGKLTQGQICSFSLRDLLAYCTTVERLETVVHALLTKVPATYPSGSDPYIEEYFTIQKLLRVFLEKPEADCDAFFDLCSLFLHHEIRGFHFVADTVDIPASIDVFTRLSRIVNTLFEREVLKPETYYKYFLAPFIFHQELNTHRSFNDEFLALIEQDAHKEILGDALFSIVESGRLSLLKETQLSRDDILLKSLLFANTLLRRGKISEEKYLTILIYVCDKSWWKALLPSGCKPSNVDRDYIERLNAIVPFLSHSPYLERQIIASLSNIRLNKPYDPTQPHPFFKDYTWKLRGKLVLHRKRQRGQV